MDPTLRKSMVICTPFGDYENGDQSGTMSKKRLAVLAANFAKYPRQVPIYALGDHVERLDDRLPDGWVEALSINASGALVADVKIQGSAAAWVLDDLIRGASIGTVQGKNPDGSAQGEVLQHLLLTNAPFDKSLNIAAARKGGEPIASHFTALPHTEAKMADEKDARIKELEAAIVALKAASPDEAQGAALKDRDDEIVRLKAEALDLKEKLENATVDEEKHELALRVAKLERQNMAQQVREIVFRMLKEATIKPAKVDGYAKGGDEGTLSWFKASIFKGDVNLLKFAAENNSPLYTPGKTFQSGMPIEQKNVALTSEEKDYISKLGLDPEKVAARA